MRKANTVGAIIVNRKLEILKDQTKEIENLVPFVDSLREDVAIGTMEQLADIAFVTSKAEEALKMLRSKLEEVSMMAQENCAQQMFMENLRLIRTDLVTATIRHKAWHKLVSTIDKQAYAECLKSMGIPDYVADAGLVRLHGPAMAEYYATRPNELPKHLSKSDVQSVQLCLTLRERKGGEDV